jgi:hypothetical protein
MKRIFLLTSLIAVSSLAQNMPKPEFFVVHEELAKPNSLVAYEAATRDLIAAMTEKKVNVPFPNWSAFNTTDMHYYFVAQIDGFAALDKMPAGWVKAREMVGAARWDDIWRRGNETMTSYNEFVVMHRPDLSYLPANPRVATADRRYFRWEFYYLIPGKEQEAEQVAKDYIALFKQKNIGEPFDIYVALSGNDLPLWVVAIPAKSEADLVAADAQVNATVGDAIRPLQARALAVTRRFERRQGMPRPDLSYSTPMAAAK